MGSLLPEGHRATASLHCAGWLTRPEHCVNLMNDTYTEMGAAFLVNDKSRMGIYWVQLFATPG